MGAAPVHGFSTLEGPEYLAGEDLDPKRSRGCLEGIYEDLDWLGLRYDECPRRGGAVGPYRQSERFSQYDDVLARLGELGLLYPCWCSRKEVRAAAIAPHASDEGPLYAGTCRPAHMQVLGDLDRLPERKGRKPALRICVQTASQRLGDEITFDDQLAGFQTFDLFGQLVTLLSGEPIASPPTRLHAPSTM